MKKYYCLFLLLLVCFSGRIYGHNTTKSTGPGKVYLFAYATSERKGTNGLHFAWSSDKKNWSPLGPQYTFLMSDYGRWQKEKRMLTPFLTRDKNGMFYCVWALNETDHYFAIASSPNLAYWNRQNYIPVLTDNNVTEPQLIFHNGEATISWWSGSDTKPYSTITKDFKNYSPSKPDPGVQKIQREKVIISGKEQIGTIIETDWNTIEELKKTVEAEKHKTDANAATPKTDSILFSGLKPIKADFIVDGKQTKKISNMLMGVFFEDLNYAADGGLYAELIQNRDFEYSLADIQFKDRNWTPGSFWSGSFSIDSISPIHANNKHYAIIKNAAMTNGGFDGISLKAGEKYNLNVFAKGSSFTIRLKDANGKTLAETIIKPNNSWKKYSAVLEINQTVENAQLEATTKGETALDMVSLFPQKTFKGRKNGLRNDIASTIANLKPRFMRFPGGCLVHGDGLKNIYRWKKTIGPLEERIGMPNLWRYHQTMGLGFYEYFLFCEDMGAEPVPVVAAGVSCGNSATGGAGQQGGIPMPEMDEYIQDILDLIEYANGSTKTTWGKKRAEAGHPEPFNLKFIGVGNEDIVTDVFEERYAMIVKAVREKYPNVTIIGTGGPTAEGTDYKESWELADKLKLPMLDEHYYKTPGWFINNQDFYDSYDRTKSKVYLGEYASRGNTFYNALSEALYLTALERNADVVSMASYAPLLAREKHTQWNPDLIYFNGNEVKPTVNYFVQQLYGENSGDTYMQSVVKINENNNEAYKRIAVSAVQNNTTGDLIVKLVNMLPVAITPSLDLTNIITKETTLYTSFSGKPDNKNARPTVVKLTVKEALSKELPPYSFTVIRLKTK